MRVKLPDPISLACPSCALELQLAAVAAAKLASLRCPACGAEHELYYWLPGDLRHELSAAVRSRIYFEAHRFNTRNGGE